MPRSIFRDVPPALLAFAGQPFNDIMKAQSGLNGDVVHEPDAMTVARELDAGKLQLGVFFGHEFAWAKKKYAKLEPLVCTIPQPKEIQAYVLVSYYSKATNLGDLRDMKLALAKTTRDHARLFLDKRRAEEMGGGNFASTLKTDTVHDAIELLIEGDADVTVADSASWRHYQSLYPGRSQNVRELSQFRRLSANGHRVQERRLGRGDDQVDPGRSARRSQEPQGRPADEPDQSRAFRRDPGQLRCRPQSLPEGLPQAASGQIARFLEPSFPTRTPGIVTGGFAVCAEQTDIGNKRGGR